MSGEGDMRRHDMTRLIKESIGFVPHFFYDVFEMKAFLTPVFFEKLQNRWKIQPFMASWRQRMHQQGAPS